MQPIRFLSLMKKNSIFRFLIVVLSTILMVSCVDNTPSGEFIISGNIRGAEGKNIILEEITPGNRIIIDSIIIENNGSFKFSYLPGQPGIFSLSMPQKGWITFYAEKNNRLKIVADLKKFPAYYEIAGNEGSQMLQQYFTKTAANQSILDSLSQVFNTSQHLNDFYQIKSGLDAAFSALFESQQSFTTAMIRKNPTEISSLLLINQYFGNTQLFTIEKNTDLYFFLDSSLMQFSSENKHVQDHHNRVAEMRARLDEMKKAEALLSQGMPAPEISLPDQDGKMLGLSSFKGKEVLLFFWASWSPKSRATVQQLKQFYQQKNDPDFVVLAVSFDHVQKFWKAAINLEQTPWPNASDLRGFNSPVKKLYNIPDELPFFYLIDREGKIVDKDNKISEILSHLN